ncbi:MAG: family 20 glycosylhydrolase [Prevotellaceae bacterium]|nr:family 20 glycosylhydrolase [Prevotellaceae bacterium]
MNIKCKKILVIAIFAIISAGCTEKTTIRDLNILPYPKTFSISSGEVSFKISALGIKTDDAAQALSKVVKDDLYRLTGIKVKDNAAPVINLSVQSGLDKDQYQVTVSSREINIAGSSYAAVSAGWVSVLQSAAIKGARITLPKMTIDDYPDMEYRGLLVDLARNFHSVQNVKQMIDLCRWYKIKNLQLHLSDDQLFVFPSTKFPELAKGQCYTREQIKEIVEYARERAVDLVPELEGPGHSSRLRKNYPEIFGKPEYGCIDLADDKVLEAMKTLLGEVIDAFPYSHYIHIGADEVNLSVLKTLPHVAEAVKAKGFNDVHDLYLNYIVEMHKFIRSKGRQTCLWEGFNHDGSPAVKIPKDVLVFAFETLYQRPDSLVKNGYNIVNTSWQPVYIVPSLRWTPEQIHDWNYYTWTPHPNLKLPTVVLNEQERKHIAGAQMCSWEQREEMEYPALCRRLAALSERAWNTVRASDYTAFEKRMESCQAIIKQLLYPIHITAEGLTESGYTGNENNRENFFKEQVTLSVKSLLPDAIVRYTSDGSFPTATADVFPESLTIDKSTFVKIGLYDPAGSLLSYYAVFYDKKQ